MVKQLNVSPFAIYSFEVGKLDNVPTMFKYGEQIDIDIKIKLAPVTGGIMAVIERLLVDAGIRNIETTHKAYKIITKVNYEYIYNGNKYIQPLYAYQTQLTENERYSGNIYQIDNSFNIDSSMLPDDNKKRTQGYFVLEIDWEENTNNFEGNIASFALPIVEMGER